MCCGSGGGYSAAYGTGALKRAGAAVWRLEVGEDDKPLEDGKRHQDFATWVEADAARARIGRGRYFEHMLTGEEARDTARPQR